MKIKLLGQCMLEQISCAALAYGLLVCATQAQPLVIVGPGALSCQEVLNTSSDAKSGELAASWMQGFSSGMNHSRMSRENEFI